MVASDGGGTTGWLSPGGFQEMGPWFLNAACAKYGYQRLEQPVRVASLPEIVAVVGRLRDGSLK